MRTSIISRLRNKRILRCGILILWIFIWQCAYWVVGEDLLLSSPWTVFQRVCQLMGTLDFWKTVGNSCAGILAGYLCGVLGGGILGALSSRFHFVYEFIRLPMRLIQATPVASFIILTLLWIPSRRLSIFISFLMVLPLIWTNVDQGFRSVDQDLLEVAQVYHFSRWKRFRYVYWPAVMPFFRSACQVAIGFAWKSGIAAEVIVTPLGFIGKELNDAKVTLMTADMFAWTAVVILLSICFEKIFGLLLSRWQVHPKGGKQA